LVPDPCEASRRIATRVTLGAVSLSNSSHLAAMLYSVPIKPVTLPPGRARLSTKPALTGSPNTGDTIGTVRVACSNGPPVEAPWGSSTSGDDRSQLCCVLANSSGIARGPMDINPHVLANALACLL